MATADDTYGLTEQGPCAVETGAEAQVSDHIERELGLERDALREAWEKLIDHPLFDWWQDPAQLEDDGLTAPTQERIEDAVKIACKLRDAGWPPPRRIVSDGDGGIVFEYREGSDSASLCISEDGSVEFIAFSNGSLLSRRQIR